MRAKNSNLPKNFLLPFPSGITLPLSLVSVPGRLRDILLGPDLGPRPAQNLERAPQLR